MEKDCTIYFTNDKTPPYQFSSKDLGLALKTAKERNWPISSIRTPDWMLSIFTHEEYEKVVNEHFFTSLGV